MMLVFGTTFMRQGDNTFSSLQTLSAQTTQQLFLNLDYKKTLSLKLRWKLTHLNYAILFCFSFLGLSMFSIFFSQKDRINNVKFNIQLFFILPFSSSYKRLGRAEKAGWVRVV